MPKPREKYAQSPRRVALLAIVGVLVIAAAIYGAYVLGSRWEASQYEEERGDLSQRLITGPTLEIDGETYVYRNRLLTLLFMGIDREDGVQAEAVGFRNGGHADFLMLLVIDPEAETVTRLDINRDTMTEITTLGVLGNISGTRLSQISLSHGFGDGKAQSSELTVQAVERLLRGIEVDFYFAMGMDSIPILNEAVGGVPVLIEDDFTEFDPTMKIGETITLHGDQTELFVRTRRVIGDGTNTARMRRQSQFLSSLTNIIEEMVREDANSVGTLYDTMASYMITDMNRGRMINEAYKASGYTSQTLAIDGESRMGERFMEFYPDEEALEALVVETFFKKWEP